MIFTESSFRIRNAKIHDIKIDISGARAESQELVKKGALSPLLFVIYDYQWSQVYIILVVNYIFFKVLWIAG